MDENTVIDQLEGLAEGFGVKIRYEVIKQDEELACTAGGLCLLRRKHVLIINSKATAKDKIRALAMALKQFDLDRVYIRPVLRELLDKIS